MKKKLFVLLALAGVLLLGAGAANGQSIKINLPTTLAGTVNVGAEFTVSRQFTVNADVLWMPYMFKKHEQVFRALIGTAEFRYYVNPKYYYTNDMFDGFYVGPYAMAGNFNIGLKKKNSPETSENYSPRYKGWGISSGVTIGYKFFLTERLRLDINLGLGVAHLQYNKYRLGGEWADYPVAIKDTKLWIGPTKFGVHLAYNLFR